MLTTPPEIPAATLPALSDFATRWAAYVARTGMPNKFPLVRIVVTDPNVSEQTTRFLAETGLRRISSLIQRPQTRTGVFGGPEGERPGEWNNPPARLRSYLVLGSAQEGDPLCLDKDHQERVVLLNHEATFQEAQFVNSGVAQLAECVLIFQEMIEEYQREFGDEAELYEGNMPPQLVERTLARIGQSDGRALGEHGYCPAQMQDS